MNTTFPISDIQFIPCRPQQTPDGTFIGFCNLKVFDFIELNSIGVKIRSDGQIRITNPSKTLKNNLLKFYFRISDPERFEELRQAIETAVKETGMYDVNLTK